MTSNKTPLDRIAELKRTPIRVLAGPGTGKTYALMRRVARLLRDGVPPERILVCTFTRTAAKDLQNELKKLDVVGAERVRAGTLHSLCFSLLSKEKALESTGRVPRPLMNFEERFLLEDIQGENFGGIREKRKRLKAFEAAWARLQTEEPGWPNDPVDRAFQEELLSWLRFHEAMLVGEVIPETLKFLRNNPELRPIYQYVLVDEYQDLNKAEQVLIDLLSERGNLFVVGDEHQSIYSFKYAHPEGIVQFHKNHPGTHHETLNVCRRCPKQVVYMANALISNNSQHPRQLCPMDDAPEGEVYVVQWRDMESEAQGIAQFVKQRIAEGVLPGKVLILSPRRQFGYAVRDALHVVGVPVQSFFQEEVLEGDPKDLEKSKAQQAFTLLTLLANPNDRVALRCWCGFGSSSLRKGAWAQLRKHCESTGESPKTVLEHLVSGKKVLEDHRLNDLGTRFRELKDRLQTLANLRGHDLLDALFPAGEEWADPFRSLVLGAEEEDFDARTLLETLRTSIVQPEIPTEVDYVRVMSLHKAKGLTADLVVVQGCMEGLIPMVTDKSDLEEQRRLFYVAITRTKKTLVLSSVVELPFEHAKRMKVNYNATYQRDGNLFVRTIASRFLSELGPDCPRAVTGEDFLKQTVGVK